MKMKTAFMVLGLGLLGCDPVASAPAKQPQSHSGTQATTARRAFWTAFQGARYEAIDSVLEELTAAYLEQPRDPKLALLIGHSHLWRLSERGRTSEPRAAVTDDAVLAAHYFSQAQQLAPTDARIDGWLCGTQLALAQAPRSTAAISSPDGVWKAGRGS